MVNKLYDEFYRIIEESESIVIFGHTSPDGDCYGSTEGLKYALKEFYPDKKIYVSGTDWRGIFEGFPYGDEVSDEVISNSLHIVCDLADKKRIGDKRAFALPNKGMIKVDHHFFADDFGGLEIIDNTRASCADLLADILYSKFNRLPKVAANCFFLGITTDSGRYQFQCDQHLLEVSARLIQDGADPKTIYSHLYETNEVQCRFKGYMLSHYKSTFFGVTYCVVPYADCQKYSLSAHGVALCVNSIGNINSSRLWICFGIDKDGKVFTEFRSKGDDIDVHEAAVRFGGGGHFNASGCTLQSVDQIDKVIDYCNSIVGKSFGTYSAELETLLGLAQKCSKKIMSIYKKGFNVEIKDDNSPVTTADKASDKIIRDTLLKEYPSYGLLTEEDADDKIRLSKENVFIIDPLDGTTDFVAKDGMFCINLALVHNHLPVVGVVAIPARDEIYFAVKGKGAYYVKKGAIIEKIHVSHNSSSLRVVLSVSHQNKALNAALDNHSDKVKETIRVGSAIKACMIAHGKAEVCYSIGHGTKEWDTCAPQLVVEEAGGTYQQNHGEPITYNRDNVYNEDGFTVFNMKESNIISMSEIDGK